MGLSSFFVWFNWFRYFKVIRNPRNNRHDPRGWKSGSLLSGVRGGPMGSQIWKSLESQKIGDNDGFRTFLTEHDWNPSTLSTSGYESPGDCAKAATPSKLWGENFWKVPQKASKPGFGPHFGDFSTEIIKKLGGIRMILHSPQVILVIHPQDYPVHYLDHPKPP